MTDLPTGTVTVLFTDIEGSTRLLDELGAEEYGSALAEHRRVMRETFARHGGVEVDTQGDAFFVAFPTAPGALAAAQEAQEELEVDYKGDALDIGFNVNYLLDVLNNVPGSELECAFGDSSSSALISYGSEKGFKYVVMPMRI